MAKNVSVRVKVSSLLWGAVLTMIVACEEPRIVESGSISPGGHEIAGEWQIEISGPEGWADSAKTYVNIVVKNGVLTGEARTPIGSEEKKGQLNGKIDGNKVSFITAVTRYAIGPFEGNYDPTDQSLKGILKEGAYNAERQWRASRVSK